MKLPPVELELVSALSEFDIWITPSLREIQDTDRFRTELERVAGVFDTLGAATSGFADVEHCDPNLIAGQFIARIRPQDRQEAAETLRSLAAVLFLVTGKSDNNVKCQFPLYLRDHAKWNGFPALRKKAKEQVASSVPLPRVLDSERLIGSIVSLQDHEHQQLRLLREYVGFILNHERYTSQLWSIGRSYVMLKDFGRARDLLAPLVVFQVRGSVSASGGHEPEAALRSRMAEWGLEAGSDYNLGDVVIDSAGKQVPSRSERAKTRAYDFVLPYHVPGWPRRLFIQCQFYAGDSGSVSHKNVDQTRASRGLVARHFADPRFIEYVDGAGYFSSLNGDLRRLLSMNDTASFFQVRSAAVRLRRELQQIGFLVPLEIEHAILHTGGKRADVGESLRNDGYSGEEIQRALASAADRGLIGAGTGNELTVLSGRRSTARRYLLLDVAARFGAAPAPGEKLTGSLIVPGYGPFHAIKLAALAKRSVELAPELKEDWSSPDVVLEDIGWLCEQGLAMSS
jgi:hypothetical protein